MHVGLGKAQEGLGIWWGGCKGAMGDKGEQFTSNLGPRWTIPITTGGCQVSGNKDQKGIFSKGNASCIDTCIATRVRVHME
jgi:hypothetical protein